MADPLIFDCQRVLANVRRTETLDLLNRVTAYRTRMEPLALQMIETELRERGIGPQEIEEHWAQLGPDLIFLEDGCAAACSFCPQPAIARKWSWYRIFGVVPVFPRPFYYCPAHR